ncbi:DUF262 domain-containing protein [Geodermatophilus obscurus]|uniref:DUF262 domain-containing protein n=2 Tax=Geodermatophilus obscurus TaxID=1861 RepID=D2SBI2_GEOOG|nr:DUF262 domain-containing protein [Geodermatophilus obscurus]ADB76089.1 protein of unknown function DUF262 [Geodermatophilus obscurus DSM 43160]
MIIGGTMADTTQFDHDRISHLLADRLLEVPAFQRSYSWDEGNVADFLSDLATARQKQTGYFLGTVVFANATDSHRQQIVDGQQRLATTAILLVAIRDALRDFKKDKSATHIDETYLRGYDLDAEELVERIVLNPADQPAYDLLLARAPLPAEGTSSIADAYRQASRYLRELAPAEDDYRRLIEITTQLDEDVQVLVAVASDLPEAYVIFETLNDRGADLTTADLLKNYLFSQAKHNFALVQATWTKISGDFDKAEDFVKFLRYDYMSRNGHVTTRALYKALQEDIGTGPSKAKKYVQQLDAARATYLALKDVDNTLWESLDFDMRESVLAMRRFGLESSYPLIMATFATWADDKDKAARFFTKVTNWSIRALFAGRLGGSVAEKAFSRAAQLVSNKTAKNQEEVRAALSTLIVGDREFTDNFRAFGNVPLTRAKYLLAMLERAHRVKLSMPLDGMPDWSSRTVTLEHLMPRAEAKNDAVKATYVETLGNMALLEKGLNKNLEDKPFAEKTVTYGTSAFQVTAALKEQQTWTKADVDKRARELASLAPLAWPL